MGRQEGLGGGKTAAPILVPWAPREGHEKTGTPSWTRVPGVATPAALHSGAGLGGTWSLSALLLEARRHEGLPGVGKGRWRDRSATESGPEFHFPLSMTGQSGAEQRSPPEPGSRSSGIWGKGHAWGTLPLATLP